MTHDLYDRTVLFGWSAVKFAWYAALVIMLFYFGYEIAGSSYDDKPTRFEALCASLEAAAEKIETPADRSKIEDIRLDYCPD